MDPAAPRYPRVARRRGHYESFYLKAADAEAGTAVWLRYTVHKRPGGPALGSLWATLFDADGPRAAKATAVPEALAPAPRGGVTIGTAAIDRSGARGAIADLAEWQVRFEPVPTSPPATVPGAGPAAAKSAQPTSAEAAPAPATPGDAPFPYLPHRWMYAAPLPRTKALSLLPAIRVSGRVRVRDRTVTLDGWPGMVGHNWGAEHAERWIWLHGTGFDGQPEAWLDAIVGRVRIGGRTTPWVANGCLMLDGIRHRLGGLGRVRATLIDERPDRCAFVLPGRGLTVRGTVAAPPGRTVGWRYRDPAGPEHHVAHCAVADLALEVARDGAQPVRLAVAGGGTYELGMREHDHGVPLQPFDDP